MKLSRSGWANRSSTSVDYLWIRNGGPSGFHRARIPSLVVGAAARVGWVVRFCARSLLLRAAKPVRKSARPDLTSVR